MPKANAYVFHMNENEAGLFADAIDEYDGYGQAVFKFKHSRNAPLICIVVNDQKQITHIARGKRGVNAGTYQSRLNLTDVLELQTPLTVEQVLVEIPINIRHWAKKRFEDGGLFSLKAFENVVDIIAKQAPETKRELLRFTEISRQRIARLTPAERQTLGHQKEALSTALLLGGMDRTALSDWTLTDDDAPGSFLDGLDQARMREDPMIVQDLMNVPGYDFIKTVPNASAAYFEDGEKQLTVILANRLPLEEQTGTDLIYYNQTFKAFVMVQYKAMEKDKKNGSIFRFPEKQLSVEIQQMDAMMKELSKVEASGEMHEFRLNNNPFFLKFCPRIQFQPDSSNLTAGMYIPLQYWKALEGNKAMNGPQGGKRLTYSNVGRYLDNTSFATVMADAWIGTNINQSKVLENWIFETIQSGKSVTFAVKKDSSDIPSGDEMLNPYVDLSGGDNRNEEGENPLNYVTN